MTVRQTEATRGAVETDVRTHTHGLQATLHLIKPPAGWEAFPTTFFPAHSTIRQIEQQMDKMGPTWPRVKRVQFAFRLFSPDDNYRRACWHCDCGRTDLDALYTPASFCGVILPRLAARVGRAGSKSIRAPAGWYEQHGLPRDSLTHLPFLAADV